MFTFYQTIFHTHKNSYAYAYIKPLHTSPKGKRSIKVCNKISNISPLHYVIHVPFFSIPPPPLTFSYILTQHTSTFMVSAIHFCWPQKKRRIPFHFRFHFLHSTQKSKSQPNLRLHVLLTTTTKMGYATNNCYASQGPLSYLPHSFRPVSKSVLKKCTKRKE